MPDISDLPEIRPQIPDSENAFSGLLAVAQILAERARTDEKLAEALGEFTPSRERSPEQIEHVRSATADLVAPWRETVARPHSVAPPNRDPLNPPYEFSDINRLGRLAALWCAPDEHTPPRERARRIKDALRAARHVTESNDTLIIYATGVMLGHLALSELHAFAEATPPSAELARELIAALESARLSPEALAIVLKNEVHFAARSLPSINLEEYSAGMEPFGMPRPPVGAKYFHKPNQSIRWWAERVRGGLPQIDVVPISEIQFPNPDRGPATLLGILPHPDNAFGRHYAAYEFVDYTDFIRLRPLLNARISALQTYVALRADQARAGELPTTLDALVPAYFRHVPIDSTDGAQIRYSRELGAVWSVGINNYTPSSKPTEPTDIVYRVIHSEASDANR